jgi:hypothetical protein
VVAQDVLAGAQGEEVFSLHGDWEAKRKRGDIVLIYPSRACP